MKLWRLGGESRVKPLVEEELDDDSAGGGSDDDTDEQSGQGWRGTRNQDVVITTARRNMTGKAVDPAVQNIYDRLVRENPKTKAYILWERANTEYSLTQPRGTRAAKRAKI